MGGSLGQTQKSFPSQASRRVWSALMATAVANRSPGGAAVTVAGQSGPGRGGWDLCCLPIGLTPDRHEVGCVRVDRGLSLGRWPSFLAGPHGRSDGEAEPSGARDDVEELSTQFVRGMVIDQRARWAGVGPGVGWPGRTWRCRRVQTPGADGEAARVRAVSKRRGGRGGRRGLVHPPPPWPGWPGAVAGLALQLPGRVHHLFPLLMAAFGSLVFNLAYPVSSFYPLEPPPPDAVDQPLGPPPPAPSQSPTPM